MKTIEEIVQSGQYVSSTVGVSMYPMLRNRRDTIIVKPYTGRLKKYDVPLYKRGDKYVLHRIIKVLPDSYIILGDNCIQKEYGITDNDIIGVLAGFYRGDKLINMDGAGYYLYTRVWRYTYYIRKSWKMLSQAVRKLGKKILRRTAS